MFLFSVWGNEFVKTFKIKFSKIVLKIKFIKNKCWRITRAFVDGRNNKPCSTPVKHIYGASVLTNSPISYHFFPKSMVGSHIV
jgi:hypothetical protein